MKSKSAFQTVSDKQFLRQAWGEISKRNPLSRGLDNVTIKALRSNLDQNLESISADLRAQRYQFNKLRAHAIGKPGAQKARPLQIATVRDRVVMKALALVIEPAFYEFNLECSFAFIKGRGVRPAIKRIHEFVDQGNKFYFQADIIDFFGSVDRNVLWQMFSKRVRQKSLRPLLRQCFNLELEDLRAYETDFQKLFLHADSGIPQGGVLSPMLANFYLYHFDRRMLASGFNLVRYADDFVIMCQTEVDAKRAYDFAKRALESLGLRIHSLETAGSKSRIGNFTKDHLVFLGVRFEGKEVVPSDKVIKRFEAKVAEILKVDSGNSLFKTLQHLTNLINGWGKCYKMMHVKETYMKLDYYIKTSVEEHLEHLGFRLVGKNKRKQMKLLGIPSLTAMVEYRRKESTAVAAAGAA